MKKYTIIQFILGAAVLFAILYPSLDGLNHLENEVKNHCEHKYADGKNEINHSHHDTHKCYVCEFTFSHFIASDVFTFSCKNPVQHSGYTFFHSKEITQFFRGSLFSHRGPPTIIA